MKRTILALAVAAAALFAAATPASAETKTETFRFPVDILGYQVKQEMTYDVAHPKVDGFITGMSVNVVNADGTPVPIQRIMLHHIVFMKVGVQNPGCQTFTGFDSKTKFPGLAEAFYGAGEERNVLALPPGYGLPLKSTDHWLMTWMLMNHRAKEDHAFIEWKVTYDTNPNLTAVHPYWLDIVNCHADPIFNVPGGGRPGSTYSRNYVFRMPESGHIVAGGGHVHGGAKNLTISQPDCGDRKILQFDPAWGMPDNAFYHVRPILHEPGPIAMSGALTSQGIPVARGQRIKLTANYDNEFPHMRVMGISMIYVAPTQAPVDGCGPLPADLRYFTTPFPHRTSPPRFFVPLTGLDGHGNAHTIKRPPGRTVRLSSGSSIGVENFFFTRSNVAVKRGSVLDWVFKSGSYVHNVTLANGPRGFASPNHSGGATFKYRFNKPGTYRIFCALHPVDMTETVTVR